MDTAQVLANDPSLIAILVTFAVAAATIAGALAASLLIFSTSDKPEDRAG